MSNFNPKQFILNDVNNGQKYEDGEGLQPATANDIVEGVSFCEEQRQAMVQTPAVVENGGNVGVKWVDTTINGRTHKKLQFENIKGDKGDSGKDGADGVSFEEVKNWLIPYLPEQLGANGVELTFDTNTDIQIGMSGNNGGEFTYGTAYNWDIYLNSEFVGNYQGTTFESNSIILSNNKAGEHKVVMICKLENTDYCARSINFHQLDNSLKKLTSVKGFGNAFNGTSAMPDYCYYYMFDGCTQLVNAPELPAKNLANRCYCSMFGDCTSLVNAPELPAKTLVDYCYLYMFSGCTSLVTAPALPAKNLAIQCYFGMLSRTNITKVELPATTLADDCYGWMFSGCTKLTEVKCHYPANLEFKYAENWLYNITTSGICYSPNAVITYGLPSNWTAESL